MGILKAFGLGVTVLGSVLLALCSCENAEFSIKSHGGPAGTWAEANVLRSAILR